MICFLQFLFIKSSNNFIPVKIINKISPWDSIFNFFNQKMFFKPIWSVTFCKNIFIFWYSNNITNSKPRILINICVNICVWFYVNRFHFNENFNYHDMYCYIYLLYYLIYQYTHFLKLRSCIYKSFEVLKNISATTDFPSLCMEYFSVEFILNHDFINFILWGSNESFSNSRFSFIVYGILF